MIEIAQKIKGKENISWRGAFMEKVKRNRHTNSLLITGSAISTGLYV